MAGAWGVCTARATWLLAMAQRPGHPPLRYCASVPFRWAPGCRCLCSPPPHLPPGPCPPPPAPQRPPAAASQRSLGLSRPRWKLLGASWPTQDRRARRRMAASILWRSMRCPLALRAPPRACFGITAAAGGDEAAWQGGPLLQRACQTRPHCLCLPCLQPASPTCWNSLRPRKREVREQCNFEGNHRISVRQALAAAAFHLE
jgi:hypothetical protein